MDRLVHNTNCKYCGSPQVVKYGTFQGMQRYFCKECRRKFADNDAVPGMKTPVWIIALALSSYFEGMSIGKVQSEINRQHGAYYAQSTIYNWIVRFSQEAVKQAGSVQPAVSDRWLLCVTPVSVRGGTLQFMDIFDIDSEFLLASQLSEKDSEQDTIEFLDKTHSGTKLSLNHPVTVFVPDNILDYVSSLKNAKPYWVVNAARSRTEEYSKLLKKRNVVVRSSANIPRSKITNAAWQIHYNFLTDNAVSRPARKSAGAPFENWADIIKAFKK